uniref:YqaJ viral recombinase domain-containing protein n=1 Tax=Nothobranchius furzeri TaxID=105023 RepID=A0A1A8UK67_NOTFU
MIDFSSAKSKKLKLDRSIDGRTTDSKPVKSLLCPRVKKGSETYNRFIDALSKNCPKSAALMAREPYYKEFIPKSSMLPKTVLDYRTSETLHLPPKELAELCQEFQFEELTPSQVQAVETATRDQSASRIWFRQRAGRITASKMRRVLRTSPQQPSKSLIMAICYPEAYRFTTDATSYGCQHESQARGAYEKLMGREHTGFSCVNSGLWLNPRWPYMGSSPDGVVTCDCHGTGICEIKCPHSEQDEPSLRLCAGRRGFCLIGEGDHVTLDRNHDYYFQVQAQLHIVKAEYSDFVVWNHKDLFVERILPDVGFWEDVIPKVECFFRNSILPEILGQQVTNLHKSD